MLPPVCFTCGRLLADIQIPYETEIKKINNSNDSELIKQEKKRELLTKFYINNYCCRMRILSYINLIDIIL
jgi:DNA-directed RNA polymerase subunit N (RpoN/RPB10)